VTKNEGRMNEMTNSHILINQFDYLEPASPEEAITLLAQYGNRARVLAGGTDLLVHMKMERIAPQAVISINRIPGLDRIAVQDGHLHIGARATICAIENDPRVQAHYPALTDACASFSTTQVQTMGTLGGNLGNGSPASDSAPALIAFGAEVEITGPDGKRRLPLEEFFVGPGRTILQDGELLTDVILARPKIGTGSGFLKISRVAADIAKASGAVTLVRDGDRVVDCRLAFGSVAPTPMRTRMAEQMLIGQVWRDELIERAAEYASKEISPIDDVRSSAWYRREAVRVLAYDGLHRAWQRAAAQAVPTNAWDIHSSDSSRAEAAKAATANAFRIGATEKRLIELCVNGRIHQVWVAPNDLLLNVLRDQLQLTGTKYGCGIGECSACTVQMNGAPVLACLVLAVSAVGKDILTVEGLQKPNGELDTLQEAFIELAAFQCGYCTPGMLLTAKSLLAEKPRPTEDDVRHHLRGNLCRCTGYASIVRAVMSCTE
jgi:xanthine dehydrogenase iron-sulfur cluster and FAD-binding subunit A